jgi:hypothetical protein
LSNLISHFDKSKTTSCKRIKASASFEAYQKQQLEVDSEISSALVQSSSTTPYEQEKDIMNCFVAKGLASPAKELTQ